MKTTKLSKSGELYASESDTQQACVKWFRVTRPIYANLLFSIPNAGKRGKKAAPQMIAEGLVSGVFDLFLCTASVNRQCDPEHPITHYFHGLWIEMKTPDGRISPAQKDFYARAINESYAACICRNLNDFEKAVTSYMRGGFVQEDWPCK